jgi:hypothetical protein
MIDSITCISVQLMRRENYQNTAEAAAWFSAVPLGPVGVYCVADKMVNVLEVLYEPEPDPPAQPEPEDSMLLVEFENAETMWLVRQPNHDWMNVVYDITYSWSGWMDLWEKNRDIPVVRYYQERKP